MKNFGLLMLLSLYIVIYSDSTTAQVQPGFTRDNSAPLITSASTEIYTYTAGSAQRNFRFIPATSAIYTFQTSGGFDVIGTLYDNSDHILISGDDNGENINFFFTYAVTAGNTYYLSIYNFETDGITSTLNITGGGILPVELTSFTAETHEREILLKWQTATEINNYGFEIERILKT